MKIFQGNELILKFMLINISSGVAVGMMNFILPVYALSLNATSTEIGLIKGISGVGDLLMVLPAGFLVDYFGSRKMYSISCLFGGFIIMSLSLADKPSLLLLVMVFYGITRTVRTTSLSAAFFKSMNTIGAKKAGWYKGSMTIGVSFIGPMLGGLAAIAVSFTNYFVFTSTFLLAPIMVMATRGNISNSSSVMQKKFSFTDVSNNYKNLIKDKILVRSTIIETMNSACFMTFSTFITVYIIRDLGLSPGIAAMLLSLKGGATILVVFLGGALLYRSNNGVYLLAFIMTIFSLFLLGIASDITQLGIASVILGIGSGMLTLITFTHVGNVNGEKGKIAGIFSLGHGAGAIIGPTLGGIIGDVYGIQAIFLAFMVPFSALALHTFISSKKEFASNIRFSE